MADQAIDTPGNQNIFNETPTVTNVVTNENSSSVVSEQKPEQADQQPQAQIKQQQSLENPQLETPRKELEVILPGQSSNSDDANVLDAALNRAKIAEQNQLELEGLLQELASSSKQAEEASEEKLKALEEEKSQAVDLAQKLAQDLDHRNRTIEELEGENVGLQKELVDETSRAAVVETALTAVLNNYQDRFAQLNLDYFRSLATTTQDHHSRMDELNNLSALSFVSTTNHTNSLQKELVDETSRAAVVETALTAELNNYQDRFAQLTLDYFRSLATTTQDWWARIDSLSDANYIQLVQTNMSWHEIFDSLNVIYATSLIKHTSATTALQNELITEVSTNVMSRIEERIINQEKLDEATEQGKMTANELELKTDRLNQAKDRISMQSDDLVGFMERRRELRDRMHNVSSVVKDWRSKIRNAGSSLLLAQQTKSKNYGKAHKSESILAGAGGRFLSRDLERTYNMYNYSRGEFNKILPI